MINGKWFRVHSSIVFLAVGMAAAYAADRDHLITPNFQNVDVQLVFSSLQPLGKNVTVDPNMTGEVTLSDNVPLPVETYFKVVVEMLKANGYSTKESANRLQVGPKSQTSNEAPVATHVTSLKGLNSASTIASIKSLLSARGKISEIVPGEILVISDEASSIQKIRALLKETNVDFKLQATMRP